MSGRSLKAFSLELAAILSSSAVHSASTYYFRYGSTVTGETSQCSDPSRPDLTPDLFSIPPVTDAEPGSTVTSDLVTLSSFDGEITVTAGGVSSVWTVTARTQDMAPDAFAIAARTGVAAGETVTSAAITPMGYAGIPFPSVLESFSCST